MKNIKQNYLPILLGIIFGFFSLELLLLLHENNPSIGGIFSQSIIDSKINLLKPFEKKKKIIISGGSNVAYGIDSKQFLNSFGIPTINFGTMVGLGPEIAFKNFDKLTGKNDTIIFCWEYETYLFNRKNRNLNYLGMIEGPQHKVKDNFPLWDKISLSLYFPIKLLRFSTFSLFQNENKLREIYKCHWEFDNYGNVLSNIGSTANKDKKLESLNKTLINKIDIHEDLYIVMQNITEFSKSRSIQLFATWPNLFKHPGYLTNEFVQENYRTIRDFWGRFGIPIIGDPNDAMLEKEFFYDSYYHPNKKGMKVRTEKLVNEFSDLKLSVGN